MRLDKKTGLILPKVDSQMLLANGEIVTVPTGYFVHPGTAHLMPVACNVAYNTNTSKFVTTVDITERKITSSFNIS